MSKKPIKFAQWLTTNHADQHTPFGELARHARLDPTWPVRANSEHQFLDHFHSVRAPDSLVGSFQMAWKAYLLVEGSRMGRK
jgi:hypothetical protein